MLPLWFCEMRNGLKIFHQYEIVFVKNVKLVLFEQLQQPIF